MKRTSLALIMFVLISVFSMPLAALAGECETRVFVNGKPVTSDVPATIVNGSTMLPFRAILNSLGVSNDQIIWRQESKCVQVRNEGTFIFLAVGNNAALVNQTMVQLNTAPFIKNERVLVPVRFISQSLGAQVDWDEQHRIVNIQT